MADGELTRIDFGAITAGHHGTIIGAGANAQPIDWGDDEIDWYTYPGAPVLTARIARPEPTFKIDYDRINNMDEIIGILKIFCGDLHMTRKKAEEVGIDHLLDI